ncbi:hypothetical protein [Agaribacterium haliotis]|uniref:hypothetical protein n=1 Tax=Agaribacterium haliotis TaxID=2013869 RepID=UPI000BB5706C|nr:hypothetical protein [Agaribacterium haliotis]
MENECSWYDPSCSLTWLSEELKLLAVWAYDHFMQGLASLVSYIPVPDFLLNAGTMEIPAGVAWFAAPFQIEWGIGIMVSAYLARFLVRRLPVIG